MGRQVVRARAAFFTAYPRPGEPIVPRLLLGLVFDRYPSPDPGAADLYRVAQAGAGAWRLFPAQICRQVGMKVVDRTQSRLPQLPESLLATPLPDPGTALGYGIERRTCNTLRRAVSSGQLDGPWTLGRYLKLPRFGGRAVVDLLAAMEAHEGQLATRGGSLADRQLEEKVAFVVQNLPISEARARSSLRASSASASSKVDLGRLARAWVQRGNSVAFRVALIGGIRIAVRPSQVTAARAAYRTAARAVAFGGSASVLEITAQLAGAAGVSVDPKFVERLFANFVTFRWVDRAAGVFWFAGGATPFATAIRRAVSGRASDRDHLPKRGNAPSDARGGADVRAAKIETSS